MVPCPVRIFGVFENYAGLLISLGCIAPNVKIPPSSSRRGQSGPLKPWMLVRCMVEDQLDYDAQAPSMRLIHKSLKIVHVPIDGLHAGVVRDIIAVVLQR